MICLTTTGGSPEEAIDSVRSNRQWIDLFELRLDRWELLEESALRRAAELLRTLEPRIPFVLTLRRSVDGGGYAGPEEERQERLRQALLLLSPDWIDLEDEVLETAGGLTLFEEAKRREVAVIRSVHDFGGTPEDLGERLERLEAAPGDVAKYAVTTGGTADLLLLHAAAEEARRRDPAGSRILLGMGTLGTVSRLLPGAFGSLWSYASPPGERLGAPGQLTPRELVERFAFREAAAGAPLFAVLGNPVLHSGSPAYHNRRFREEHLEAAYLAFPADDIEATMELFDRLALRGVSVTIPHKEAVLAYLDEREPSVEALGAANTLTRTGAQRWRGTNTDVPGFLAPLREERTELSGSRALVIGAGGAARAVVYALFEEGTEVTIANRTVSRGEALLRSLGVRGRVLGLDAAPLREEQFDLIVQTTSVGMDGESEPVPHLPISGESVVYDIIYTPPETPLILRARAAGATVITGDRMFRAQAAEQFSLFRPLAGESPKPL